MWKNYAKLGPRQSSFPTNSTPPHPASAFIQWQSKGGETEIKP
jgi:hypothetical protein